MKANTSFTPNKKLILHFDIDSVLKINSKADKDFFVYQLCAQWVWGKLDRSDKNDPDKITGWKIAFNTLSIEAPEPDLITYKIFLDQYLKPNQEEYQKLILNLSKGPASKAKSEIQKNIKNITLPKTLAQAVKEGADPNDQLLAYFNKTGKYQILPAFFKLLMNLKKMKRQFAVVLKGSLKENYQETISELNRFFGGEHPLFNGRNGTPAIKWDGSKGTRNFLVQQSHQTVFYELGQQLFATYGSINVAEQKDPEMFKQKFKSFRKVKLCQGVQQIYSVGHTILAQSACIYEINPLRLLVIDPADYLTQEIYFTNSQQVKVHSCTGEIINNQRSFVYKVSIFEYLRDIDYFIKAIQLLQGYRASEIQKIEKGQVQPEQNNQEAGGQKSKETNYEYLKKNLLPVLQGALRQVDILRPEDPLGFIALYCLKNRDKLQ